MFEIGISKLCQEYTDTPITFTDGKGKTSYINQDDTHYLVFVKPIKYNNYTPYKEDYGRTKKKSHFVIVENKRCICNSLLIKTEDYKTLLERSETYPPDIVHFLVHTNKRNVQNINNSLLSPRQMSLFRVWSFVVHDMFCQKFYYAVCWVRKV